MARKETLVVKAKRSVDEGPAYTTLLSQTPFDIPLLSDAAAAMLPQIFSKFRKISRTDS